MALLGNTPIKLGPSPLKSPDIPSCTKMCLKKSIVLIKTMFGKTRQITTKCHFHLTQFDLTNFLFILNYLRHCTMFMDGGAVGGITVEDDNLTDEIIDIEALECMLATGTVICMGPLTAISGVYTEFRMEPFELDTALLMVSLVSEGTEGEVPNPEFED